MIEDLLRELIAEVRALRRDLAGPHPKHAAPRPRRAAGVPTVTIEMPPGMKNPVTVPYVEGWYACGKGEAEDSCRFEAPDGHLWGIPHKRCIHEWHRGWQDAKEAGFVCEPIVEEEATA